MNASSRRRDLVALLLVAASGWLCAQAYPGAAHRELAWVALVPFLLCVRGATPARAVALGAWWMLCFAWGINDWFPGAVARYLAQPLPVGFAFFLGVTLGTAAPATMAFALYYRLWGRSASALAPLAAAAAWVAFEFLRSQLLGDPWGLLGYSQALRPQWIQVADFAGVYGVSFVVLFVNALIAEVLIAAANAELTISFVAAIAAMAMLVPGAAFAYGGWRLGAEATSTARGIDVAVVQGNLDLESQWTEPMHAANLEKYLDLSHGALAAGRADLLVWPENAVTFFLAEKPDLRASIAATLAPARTGLLLGGPHRDANNPDVFFNSAYLVASDGTIRSRYDKRRLLPFGEYQPLQGLDLVASRFDRMREFSPGSDDGGVLDSDGVRIGVVICNEAMFAQPARDSVAAGAEALFVLTNDSWVGVRKFAEQAMDKAVLRAVEQRRWLVRVSTWGPSAIVDDRGRVTARTAFAQEATLSGRVTLRDAHSVYARLGDAFAWVCAAALFVRRPHRGRAHRAGS